MSALLDLEHQYRRLQDVLGGAASARLRLLAIAQFLDQSTETPVLYHSYLLELSDYLPSLVQSARLDGLDPDRLRPIVDAFAGFALYPELAAALQSLDRLSFNPERAETAGGVRVPVVEQLRGVDLQAGALRTLTLSLYDVTRGEGDEIVADVAVFGGNGQRGIVDIPLTATRALLSERYPALVRRHYSGRIDFEAERSLHTGSSANLAMAVLFYCAVLRQAQVREQVRMAPGAAFTGDLDEQGQVLPVQTETLGLKVEATFFSGVTTLAVPEPQRAEAERYVEQFQQRYPDRRLTVLGVRHLPDVFFDRRLIERRRVPWVNHIAQHAWRRKFSVGGIVTIATLLLIIARLLYGPVDQIPVSGEFGENVLYLKSQFGAIEVPRAEPEMNRAERMGVTRFQLADLDGDGRKEVLWTEPAQTSSAPHAVLKCKTVGSDSLWWTASLELSVDFPASPDAKTSTFSVSQVLVGAFDGSGKPSIYVNAHHVAYFPAVIARLDPYSGKMEEYYLHSGWFSIIRPLDLDGDGMTELVVGGGNQTYSEAYLIVLDPRFLSGFGPAEGEYVAEGYGPGLERWYVRFPWSRLKERLRYLFSSGWLRNVLSTDQGLQVWVQEGLAVDVLEAVQAQSDTLVDRALLPDRAWFIGEFDFGLKPVAFGTSSYYDRYVEYLRDLGFMDEVPNRAYWEAYGGQLQYWDGDDWVTGEPVQNRHYLEALEAWEVERSSE